MKAIIKTLENDINEAVVSYMHDEKNWGHSQPQAYRKGFLDGMNYFSKLISNGYEKDKVRNN